MAIWIGDIEVEECEAGYVAVGTILHDYGAEEIVRADSRVGPLDAVVQCIHYGETMIRLYNAPTPQE